MGALLAGFALGVFFTMGVVWLPSQLHWRRKIGTAQADTAREIRRIEGGFNWAGVDPDLADAAGAIEQARHAYLPIYPGRQTEPDPAWVSWVEAGGARVTQSRRMPDTSGDETQPLIRTVQVGTVDVSSFPQWGRPSGGAPAGWLRLRWSWREWGLAPLALILIVSAWLWRPVRILFPPRSAGYTWYQKVADRVWEAGVVFEVSAQRTNNTMLRSAFWFAERMWWGLVDIRLVLAAVGIRRFFPGRRIQPTPVREA